MIKVLPKDRAVAARNCVVFAALFLYGALLIHPSRAALTGFESYPWNSEMIHIVRDNQPVAEPLPDLLPVYQYFYIEDVYEKSAICHSGAAAGDPQTWDPQIYLHLFAYTQPEEKTEFYETSYYVQNQTGNKRIFSVSKNELGIKNKRRKSITMRSSVILHGSLIFVKEPDDNDGFDDLFASFEVLLTRENGKKIFKGSVELETNKKGKVKVKTSGKIKKKHISAIEEGDNIFEIKFVDVYIPYKTKVKFDVPYEIKTEVYSKAINNGDGTGSEVIFGPGEPSLPYYQDKDVIPEPTTVILLGTGAVMVFYRTCRRASRRSKQKNFTAANR